MIIKKKTGKGFGGLVNYLMNDKKDGIQERAEIIGGNVFGDSNKEIASQFSYAYSKKPEKPKFRKHTDKKTGEITYKEVEFKPVRHFAFNPADDDRELTQQELNAIADDFLEKMGFKNCSYIVVKHKDENINGKTHIHIATSQYDLNGKRVDEHGDVAKLKKLARGYEKKYKLRELQNKAQYSLSGQEFSTNSDRYIKHKKRRNKTAYYKQFNDKKQSKRNPSMNFAEYKYFQLYHAKNSMVKYCAHYNPNEIFTRLKNNDSVTDKGHSLTASTQKDKLDNKTIKTMVEMAHSKGMKRVVASGNDEFVLKSWAELEDKGIELSIKPEQGKLFEKYEDLKTQMASKAEDKTPVPAFNASAHDFDKKKKQEEEAKAEEEKAKKKHDELWQSHNSNEYSPSDIDHDDGGSPSTPRSRKGPR